MHSCTCRSRSAIAASPGAARCPHRGRDTAACKQETVDRERRPCRSDHQWNQKQAERVVEAEDIERRTVDRADQAGQGHDRRQRRGQPDRQQHRGNQRDAAQHAGPGRRRRREIPAPLPGLIVGSPDVVRLLPACRAEEGIDIEQPDCHRPGEEQPGGDPDHGEGQRIGGGEPEVVPPRGPVMKPGDNAGGRSILQWLAHRSPFCGQAYVPSGIDRSSPALPSITSSGAGR